MRLKAVVAAISAPFALTTVTGAQTDEGTAYRTPDSAQQRTIRIDDATFTADVWGTTGETIIAIPGLGGDAAWYRLLAPSVAAAGYRFVALNPRGVRGSTGSLEALTLEVLAEDIAATIESLGVGQAHLVGWAFGNRVARAASKNYPDAIATVTLLAAGGRFAPSETTAEIMEILGTSDDLSPEQRLALRKAVYFSPLSDAPKILASIPSGLWPEATAAQRTAARSARLDAWWSGGDVPMLVIQGLDDKVALPENGRALRDEDLDRVTLVELQDAGHMLLVEQPDRVATSIIAFLKNHPIVGDSLVD